MKQNTVTYETGATSHAVNDLILFTDTTQQLARLRDSVYNMYVSAYKAGYKGNVSWVEFQPLFMKAVNQYRLEIKEGAHVGKIKQRGMEEYCTIYANRYNAWKLENGYK
jgi:hypothetical protein